VARLAYLDPQLASQEVRDELARIGPLGELNLTRMTAHADMAFLYYLAFAGTLLTRLQLDARLRELAVLLVAARCESEYEWVQHVSVAGAFGIGTEQIAAIRAGDLEADCLDEDARIVLRFTSQVLDVPRADDEAFAALSERFSPREIVELMFVIGNYQMLARIMTTLDVEIDPALGGAAVDVAEQRMEEQFSASTEP
jgi:alkylhydroperoxidase family enzyme